MPGETITPILGDLELSGLQRITTGEQRALVEHRVPGMAGSAFQDLGRSAARITLKGLFSGATAPSLLKALRASFHAAEPLPFTADITTATEIIDVLIEDLQVVEVAGRPRTFACHLVLRESPPPLPPTGSRAAFDAGILDDARDLFDQAIALEEVLDTLGSVPDFADPTVPLEGTLVGVKTALGALDHVTSALNAFFGDR